MVEWSTPTPFRPDVEMSENGQDSSSEESRIFVFFLFWKGLTSPNERLHPGRLTWNIIMEVSKIVFLSKWVICRFHLNLPGCTWNYYFYYPQDRRLAAGT